MTETAAPTPAEYAVAIREAISEGVYFGRVLPDIPSRVDQLYTTFKGYREGQRDAFRRGLTRLIHEWIPRDDLAALHEVIRLVGFVRATDAILPLRTLLEAEFILRAAGDMEAQKIVGTSLAVLQGLAPNPAVEEVLVQFLLGEVVAPRYGTRLLLGVCECAPSRFGEYLPRYLSLVRRYPQFYTKMGLPLENLLNAVSFDRVVSALERLSGEDRTLFVSMLSSDTGGPVHMSMLSDGIMMRRTSSNEQRLVGERASVDLVDALWLTMANAGTVQSVLADVRAAASTRMVQ